MSGDISRSMNIIYGRSMQLIRHENLSFQNKADLLRALPEVILLIEQLFKHFEGKNKKRICMAVLEMLINNLVQDPNIKESLHEFLRSDIPEIINNMVYLGNVGVKYFKSNRNCLFMRKFKKSH